MESSAPVAECVIDSVFVMSMQTKHTNRYADLFWCDENADIHATRIDNDTKLDYRILMNLVDEDGFVYWFGKAEVTTIDGVFQDYASFRRQIDVEVKPNGTCVIMATT